MVVVYWIVVFPRHPERSRFSGGAQDLAWGVTALRARSLGPPVKARAFGMTHAERTGFAEALLRQEGVFP